MLRHLFKASGALMIACVPLTKPVYAANDPASFYHGKTIQIIVGYGPGGGYDLYARMVAQFLGDHIPGHPTVIVQNMPGGGGRAAMTYAFKAAPQDGTVLVTADQSLVLDQALGDPDIHFDLRKMNAIGNPTEDNNNLVTWHTSGIASIADAQKRVVTVGSAPGAALDVPLALNAIVHTKFKPILGYAGGNEIDLAMERGEVEGRAQNSFAVWKASKPDWLRDKKINLIVQWGPKKAAGLSDVPLMTDLASAPDDKTLLSLFSVPTILGRPFFATPNVPADRVNALRTAFQQTVADPAFVAGAKKAGLDLNPVDGAEMQNAIATALATPEPILDKLRRIIAPSR